MPLTKVTRNYQITLPKEVREQASVNVGDTIVVTVDNGNITLKKRSSREALDRAFGIFTSIKGDSVDYVRKMRAESEKRARRLGL